MTTFPCPTCGDHLTFDDEAVGHVGRCPRCQELLRVWPNKATIAKQAGDRTVERRDRLDRSIVSFVCAMAAVAGSMVAIGTSAAMAANALGIPALAFGVVAHRKERPNAFATTGRIVGALAVVALVGWIVLLWMPE